MTLGSIKMKVDDYDSLIFYVSDLSQAKAFYADTLGFPCALRTTSSWLLEDLRDRSSCIGTTEATMREESFQRGQRPERHPCASR